MTMASAMRPMASSRSAASLRLGFPVTEYVSFGTRYSLIQDEITLDEDISFTDLDDPDGDGPLPDPEPFCDPLKAGRYLCDELGKNLTSAIGYYGRLRQHQRHSCDPRPAHHRSARISPVWAAT